MEATFFFFLGVLLVDWAFASWPFSFDTPGFGGHAQGSGIYRPGRPGAKARYGAQAKDQ